MRRSSRNKETGTHVVNSGSLTIFIQIWVRVLGVNYISVWPSSTSTHTKHFCEGNKTLSQQFAQPLNSEHFLKLVWVMTPLASCDSPLTSPPERTQTRVRDCTGKSITDNIMVFLFYLQFLGQILMLSCFESFSKFSPANLQGTPSSHYHLLSWNQ